MTIKPFEMHVSKTVGGGAGAVVQVEGFLDAHTVVGFEEQMNGLLEGGAAQIIMDMERLNYISSAGIGAMMSLVQRLRRQAGNLILLRPSKKVFKILQLLGFTEMFTIVDDEEDALAHLRAEPS